MRGGGFYPISVNAAINNHTNIFGIYAAFFHGGAPGFYR